MPHSPLPSDSAHERSLVQRTTGASPPVPLAYGIGDAVAVSGIGRTTLYGLIASGRLASSKVGARRLIRRDDLLDLLNGKAPSNGEQP